MSRKLSALVESVIAFLLPYFARAEIMDTLTSYGTRTRAEFLQAARVIALSMTTLDVLAEAKTAEMSQSMRIRFRGCANGLNRSTIQTEKSLDKNLARDAPAAPEPAPEPANELAEDQVEGAVEHARAAIEAHRSRLPATTGRPATTDERDKKIWAGAMMDTLKQLGYPVQPIPGTA